jgi:hypothetical protein
MPNRDLEKKQSHCSYHERSLEQDFFSHDVVFGVGDYAR